MTRFALFLLISLSLSACSGLELGENTAAQDNSDDTGSFLTGKDKAGIVISDIGSRKI